MDEIIRKIIYNNCGIQDGATLVGYIEELLDRNNKAIEYIEEKAPQSLCLPNGVYDMREIDKNELLKILRGDKE